MSKQQKLILLVAVLVMANIWRWYITGEPAEETRANSEVVTPEELLAHASVAGEAGTSHAMRRDLFQVKVSPREKIIKPIAKPVRCRYSIHGCVGGIYYRCRDTGGNTHRNTPAANRNAYPNPIAIKYTIAVAIIGSYINIRASRWRPLRDASLGQAVGQAHCDQD